MATHLIVAHLHFDMDRPERSITSETAIPVAPGFDTIAVTADTQLRAPAEYEPVDQSTIIITALASRIGIAAGIVAQVLVHLIGFVTNLAFYGRFSLAFVSPG